MTLLPNLEAELVAAAGRRRRARVAALPALMTAACAGLALVALPLPDFGKSRDATQSRPQLADVPAATLTLARALAMEPAHAPDGGRQRVLHRDLPAVAEEIKLRTPYPPGVEDAFDWAATPDDPGNMGSFNVRADVRSFIHYRAWCSWQRFWLRAHDARAAQPASDAAQVLTDSTQWSTRPGGSMSRVIAEAARRNEPAALQRYTRLNCG